MQQSSPLFCTKRSFSIPCLDCPSQLRLDYDEMVCFTENETVRETSFLELGELRKSNRILAYWCHGCRHVLRLKGLMFMKFFAKRKEGMTQDAKQFD